MFRRRVVAGILLAGPVLGVDGGAGRPCRGHEPPRQRVDALPSGRGDDAIVVGPLQLDLDAVEADPRRGRGRRAGVGEPDREHGHGHHHDPRDRRDHLHQGQRRWTPEPGRSQRDPGGRGYGPVDRVLHEQRCIRPGGRRCALTRRRHPADAQGASSLSGAGGRSTGMPSMPSTGSRPSNARRSTSSCTCAPRGPTSRWRRTRLTRRGSPPPPST